MNAPITLPDATPPSAPGTLTATGTLTSAQLSWGAATDNVGVVRYNVHRGTTAGFTPTRGEPDRAADRHHATRTRSRAGTYYYKVTAEDAAGNVGPRLERGERDRRRHHRAVCARDAERRRAPSARRR